MAVLGYQEAQIQHLFVHALHSLGIAHRFLRMSATPAQGRCRRHWHAIAVEQAAAPVDVRALPRHCWQGGEREGLLARVQSGQFLAPLE